MSYGNEYSVKFFYGTDLRTDIKVYAHNEVSALSIAIEKAVEGEWLTDKGFRIEIEKV